MHRTVWTQAWNADLKQSEDLYYKGDKVKAEMLLNKALKSARSSSDPYELEAAVLGIYKSDSSFAKVIPLQKESSSKLETPGRGLEAGRRRGDPYELLIRELRTRQDLR